jgi:hypothetical protein
MRYFFISDVHGEFNDMIKALDNAGFNPEQDTLVSLGDLMDRGPDSKKVIEYVLGCRNKILIWGNHDLAFYQVLNRIRGFSSADETNGMLETMKSFDPDYDGNIWDSRDRLSINPLLREYFHLCNVAVRWSNLIAVHAWVPCDKDGAINLNQADGWDWEVAVWSNTARLIQNPLNYPDRKIIIGHWHAWRLRPETEDFKILLQMPEINFDTYETDKFIAIDGCTNLSHQVNVYVFETDEEPEIIVPRRY